MSLAPSYRDVVSLRLLTREFFRNCAALVIKISRLARPLSELRLRLACRVLFLTYREEPGGAKWQVQELSPDCGRNQHASDRTFKNSLRALPPVEYVK